MGEGVVAVQQIMAASPLMLARPGTTVLGFGPENLWETRNRVAN